MLISRNILIIVELEVVNSAYVFSCIVICQVLAIVSLAEDVIFKKVMMLIFTEFTQLQRFAETSVIKDPTTSDTITIDTATNG